MAIMHVIDLVFVIPDWVPVVLHDLRLEAGLASAGRDCYQTSL